MNAFGFLSTIESIASFLSSFPSWFAQSAQLQSGEQPKPKAKQSQYNLRHFDFLQLQVVFYGWVLLLSEFRIWGVLKFELETASLILSGVLSMLKPLGVYNKALSFRF